MKFEKSCGALIYKETAGIHHILVLKNRNGGHWSFPKGHVEKGETEIETAIREVREETGLEINIKPGFRESVEYSPKPHVKKEVIYFIAEAITYNFTKQEEEIRDIRWMTLEEATKQVTYQNDKYLLSKAKNFILNR